MIQSLMKYKFYALLLSLAAVSLLFIIFKSNHHPNDTCQTVIASMGSKTLPIIASQLMLVQSFDITKAEITTCQRQNKVWQQVSPTFLGVIGKNGVAPLGEKKEGDLKTPAGFYPLGEVFGSQPMALKMDYKYITSDDKFVDDINHTDYNHWVNGKTDAKSYEPMLIAPYKMGIVVNYNMNPVIKGAGSAIFIHLWQSINVPTFGCIAMDEPHLLAILHWLDKNQHPYIYIIR